MAGWMEGLFMCIEGLMLGEDEVSGWDTDTDTDGDGRGVLARYLGSIYLDI